MQSPTFKCGPDLTQDCAVGDRIAWYSAAFGCMRTGTLEKVTFKRGCAGHVHAHFFVRADKIPSLHWVSTGVSLYMPERFIRLPEEQPLPFGTPAPAEKEV